MSELTDRALIHDWNQADEGASAVAAVIDATFYEAVHAPGVTHPDLAASAGLLRRMSRLPLKGVHLGQLTTQTAPRIDALCRIVVDERLGLTPVATIEDTVEGVEAAVRLGHGGLELAIVVQISAVDETPRFDGLDRALQAAISHRLPVRVMAHDATRAHPSALRHLVSVMVARGASNLCLWDSAGQASPDGVRHLLGFVRGVAGEHGGQLELEWFGRNDRDLAVINSLEALRQGATTIHATALGLGHGAGSTPLDILLANLQLLEVLQQDLAALKPYCEEAAQAFGVSIPINYPIFGGDAFRTATGVHAAAIIKAQNKGDHWLADRVYSGVPAGAFGLAQIIDVGPMSGESNVVAWLRRRDVEPQPELVKRIIRRAKSSTHILSADEITEEIRSFGAAEPSGH